MNFNHYFVFAAIIIGIVCFAYNYYSNAPKRALIKQINSFHPSVIEDKYDGDNDYNPVTYYFPNDLVAGLYIIEKSLYCNGIKIPIKELNLEWKAYFKRYFLIS